jgi:DNA-binding transcriptional ArsR family regulator
MAESLDERVQHLRAVAEPTRLRILAVLAPGELSVSDLAAVLGQSQPRVSRHLKVLCDSGLLLRSREQHWMYYRLPNDGDAAEFLRDMLASLDSYDPVLALDRERAGALLARRTGDTASAGPDTHRDEREESGELGAVLGTELGSDMIDSILYVGSALAVVMPELAGRAHRAVAVSESKDEIRRTRARAHGRGLSHCELRLGDPASLPFAAGTFDVVIVDRVNGADQAALREAGRVLRRDGRLVVIDDYERLEAQAAGVNPLIASRERLARAGLTCTRLRPLDLDSSRLLLALAAPTVRRDAAA